jgi:hypothetical protein
VNLPASLMTIASTSYGTSYGTSFLYCSALTTITVDIGNTTFSASSDGKMLLNKAGTTLIAYPSATGAVTLPATITTIGDYAFEDCDSLSSVSLPNVTTIGDVAFLGCTSLSSVSLPEVTTIGNGAFQNCESLSSVSLPEVTTIGGSAFEGCESLSSVSLPAVTTIGNYAFEDCDSLTTVSLPNVTTIDHGAFYGCDSLTTVSLPKVTTIDYTAFAGCESLSSVSLPATPPTIGSDIFYRTGSSGTITITVPSGAVSAYTTAWDVSATTATGGNTTKYGDNHKAVVITS